MAPEGVVDAVVHIYENSHRMGMYNACMHVFIPCFVVNAEILWGALCHRDWSGCPSTQGERRDGQRFVANLSLSFAYVIFVKMENLACHEF